MQYSATVGICLGWMSRPAQAHRRMMQKRSDSKRFCFCSKYTVRIFFKDCLLFLNIFKIQYASFNKVATSNSYFTVVT